MVDKKENKSEGEICYHNSQMTLKPTQKHVRKNKRTRLQQLYNEGKVTTEEFYQELTKFIKWRLMPDLIRRGYYINGVRQINFTRDEVDSCYTHVLHKIIHEYSPEKGTLATYVRWQVRGWGQLVIQKQVRHHKYNPNGMLSLDNPNMTNIRLEYRNRRAKEDIEEVIDYESFGNSIFHDLTQSDIEDIREKVKDFKTKGEGFGWLVE